MKTPKTPRTTLSARVEALTLPQAAGYASFIRTGDTGGPIPCWGAITERFDADFTTAADRVALWDIFIDDGDRRPLLLFLHLNRAQPAVMAAVFNDANRLPVVLQRALVTFDELASDIPNHLSQLGPSARELWAAGPDALARERELVEARIATLMAFRFFVPDAFDPADETSNQGGKV